MTRKTRKNPELNALQAESAKRIKVAAEDARTLFCTLAKAARACDDGLDPFFVELAIPLIDELKRANGAMQGNLIPVMLGMLALEYPLQFEVAVAKHRAAIRRRVR
jgi:hypothetical protein